MYLWYSVIDCKKIARKRRKLQYTEIDSRRPYRLGKHFRNSLQSSGSRNYMKPSCRECVTAVVIYIYIYILLGPYMLNQLIFNSKMILYAKLVAKSGTNQKQCKQ